jgi:hypothetical protein
MSLTLDDYNIHSYQQIHINYKIKINTIIHLYLREYLNSFIIYLTNLNIIHFILYNNMNIEKLLNIILIFIL